MLMKTKLYPYMFISSLLILNACSKDDNKSENFGENIHIETFKGRLNMDISDRSNWELNIKNTPYYFNYTNNSLLSIPESETYVIEKSEVNSSGYLKDNKSILITFKHPNYFPSSKPTYPQTPDIADQSTSAKILKADMLYCEYKGKVENNIEGELVHANALVDFNILDHPNNSKFFVTGSLYVTPFFKLNRYKAIMPAYGNNNSIIIVMTQGTKSYYAELCGPNTAYSQPNTHYKFSVKYNSVYDQIEIIDSVTSTWEEENWY